MNFKKIFETYPFIIMPILFLLATVFIDMFMYYFMGLHFPSRYYFSVLVLLSICGLLIFIKRPLIQMIVCLVILALHFTASVANIIMYNTVHEITSLESLLSLRQVAATSELIRFDYDYFLAFSCVMLAFIGFSVWALILIKRARSEQTAPRLKYKHNLSAAIALLSIVAYITPGFYYITLPNISTDATDAYANYNNDRFIYSTFNNRTKILQEFGTYSFFWSNISFALGLKKDFTYDLEDNIVNDFTFNALPQDRENVMVFLMETIEDRAINEVTMPNFSRFTEKCISVEGYRAVDRTCMAEYGALAGVALDAVEMYTFPNTEAPYALPNILSKRRGYDSVKSFHNFIGYFYNRDRYHINGLGFDEYVSIEKMTNMELDTFFNHNSDYLMFEGQVNKMAPSDKKFFSFVENISSHSPYYGINLRDIYPESFAHLEKPENLAYLESIYSNLKSSDPKLVEAVKNYLAGVYEYDRGLGILFDRLENTRDTNGNLLIDTTTLVFFGDHFNYMEPNLLNSTPNETVSPAGSPLPFYIYSSVFNTPTRSGTVYKGGDKIQKFMSSFDIYATICDILHIEINTKYSLGISVFNTKKAGIGFSIKTGLIYNDKFSTYDFKNFYLPPNNSIIPSDSQIGEAKTRLSYVLSVMQNLRPLYWGNKLKNIPETYYL